MHDGSAGSQYGMPRKSKAARGLERKLMQVTAQLTQPNILCDSFSTFFER